MKVIKWIDEHLEEVLLAALLIGIAVVMILQVICRYIFNNSLTWSDELARFLLVWSCFLSTSFCVKKHISIKIDQLQNAISPKAARVLRLIRHLVIFVFCILMIPYALTYVQQAIRSGATSSALHLPMYFIQSGPLVGFVLLALRTAEAFFEVLKGGAEA